MKVKINEVHGYAGAILSMYMSKRTYNAELADLVASTCSEVLYPNGYIKEQYLVSDEAYTRFMDWMKMIANMSKRHITIGKFISFTGTCEGLHRAGQDDFDAHAFRLWNRIIRNSTRLSTFSSGEISDWYKGKIIPMDQALEKMNMEVPDKFVDNGSVYIRSTNGYIREDLKDNKDVKRGLYMLSIPSTFVFECSLTEWGHIIKERGDQGSANPEVKELAETITKELTKICPIWTKDWFMSIQN